MPKEIIQSNKIVSYRLDIIENRITTIEKRLDALVTTNNGGGSNEKINMELLNMLMSFIKTPLGDHHTHHPQPRHHDNDNDIGTIDSNSKTMDKSKNANENDLASRIYSMQRLSTV